MGRQKLPSFESLLERSRRILLLKQRNRFKATEVATGSTPFLKPGACAPPSGQESGIAVKYFRLLIAIGSIAVTACTQASPKASISSTPIATSSPLSTAPSPGVPPQPATSLSPILVKPAPPSPTTTITKILPPLPTPQLPAQVGDYQVIDELKQPQFMAESQKIFKSASLPHHKVNFNAADLLVVLTSTRKYFIDRVDRDPDLQREGILATQGVTVTDIIKTLDFMVSTLQADIKAKRSIRLQDPKFLNTHFRTIEWQAFNPIAPANKRLRLTKYAVFTHPGSRQPTKQFNVGLYALKSDPNAEQLRVKYTKQDVLKNIYEPQGIEFGAVEPLAYLDRAGLESALMEGTVLIKFTDGTSAFFNVDRHNNIPYIKGLAATEQQRYWYFKPVNAIKGYGQTIETKISLKPGVTFAGDVLNIGLGKIIVTESSISGKPELRMGIIADTGGAFLPNLHQLDFLAGIFDNHEDFTAYTRKLPEYVKAYILVKK